MNKQKKRHGKQRKPGQIQYQNKLRNTVEQHEKEDFIK